MMRSTVSLLLTSRPHITLGTSLESLPNFAVLEICASDEKYINQRIQDSSRLALHVQTQPELQEEIITKIRGTVYGKFLLAKLHIESLSTKSTIKAVREALENLPKDLEQTYNDTIDRINDQG
ncbi:hypothetical protein B0H14DRAFT_2570143 [Mycena olivaceomarginata]|nr:hypothetical protein B0H14DRAFT_2570143 [Mycena olivaceomarginata]